MPAGTGHLLFAVRCLQVFFFLVAFYLAGSGFNHRLIGDSKAEDLFIGWKLLVNLVDVPANLRLDFIGGRKPENFFHVRRLVYNLRAER